CRCGQDPWTSPCQPRRWTYATRSLRSPTQLQVQPPAARPERPLLLQICVASQIPLLSIPTSSLLLLKQHCNKHPCLRGHHPPFERLAFPPIRNGPAGSTSGAGTP